MNKVLIVDDCATTHEVLMRALGQAGLQGREFLGVGNGVKGIKRPVKSPEVDLVPGDINRAQMDGVAFVEAVRKKLIPEDLVGEES